MKAQETITPPKLEAIQVADQQYVFKPKLKVPVAFIEPPTIVPKPTEQYINLGDLDSRTAARMALRCFARDVMNLGQTHKYQEFKQKRWEEQNLAFDMSVGLVEQVHCRLHERVLAHSTGREG